MKRSVALAFFVSTAVLLSSMVAAAETRTIIEMDVSRN